MNELEILRRQRLDLIKTVDRLRSANCTPHVQSENEELKKQILELKELVRDARPLIESKIYTITNEEYLKRSEEALSK